jgi:hypothetical protein
VLKRIEEQLATEAMSPVVQQALQQLLNLVEHLVADKQAAIEEVQRLPKIREFLENFDVQISRGSLSNILTNAAGAFEGEVRDVVLAGLASTLYQQTDDTAARVAGQFWHTHILCNPFYTAYFTRPHKDRLTVLAVLQNQTSLRFRFNAWTRELLERWQTPQKWRDRVAALGDDVEFEAAALRELLDSWFGEGAGGASRDDLEQAGASRRNRWCLRRDPIIEWQKTEEVGPWPVARAPGTLLVSVALTISKGRRG